MNDIRMQILDLLREIESLQLEAEEDRDNRVCYEKRIEVLLATLDILKKVQAEGPEDIYELEEFLIPNDGDESPF